MGTREDTSSKSSKATPPREPPCTPSSYPDWAAAFQAYYGPGAAPPYPGYFPHGVTSGPQPPAYMWAGQPMMAPYATPTHPALYPYGGMYPHPALTMGMQTYGQYAVPSPCTELVMAAPTPDTEVKFPEAKDQSSIKRSKGNTGSNGTMNRMRSDEAGKGTSSSANGHSHSGESGTEHSTEASEDEFTLNAPESTGKDGVEKSFENGHNGHQEAYHIQSGQEAGNVLNEVAAGKPATAPGTNLNIGMDYWTASTSRNSKGKRPAIENGLVSAGPGSQFLVPVRDNMGADLWIQDEKELKKQRRKQSNRESARRSRLRKQAECDELSARVDTLTAENSALRVELDRLAEECKRLFADNAVLSKKVQSCDSQNAGAFQGPDATCDPQGAMADQTFNQSFGMKDRSSFKLKNNQRVTEVFESGATVLQSRGPSDVIAAG